MTNNTSHNMNIKISEELSYIKHFAKLEKYHYAGYICGSLLEYILIYVYYELCKKANMQQKNELIRLEKKVTGGKRHLLVVKLLIFFAKKKNVL